MAGSIFSWRFTLGGFGGCYTQWYRGTGRQKTTEGTGDHQNQQGTRDPPKKKQRNRQNAGKPHNKAWAGAKAGARKPPNKSSGLSPWG